MAKKKVKKPRREVTRRQLSQWQRERRRQRFIVISGSVVVAVVVLVMGLGWFFGFYQPLHQVVVRVNDTEFNMDYYIDMLRYYGQDWPEQYISIIADETVTYIERNEMVRKAALELGIVATDEEIKERLESYDPPLGREYRDIARAELLMNKMYDRYFEQLVPVAAGQRQLMAMFLESESRADDIRRRIEAGEDFGELASELSLDTLSQEDGGELDWHPQDALALRLGTEVPGEYAFNPGVELGVVSQPLYDDVKVKDGGYWLIKVEDKQSAGESESGSETIMVRAMLLGTLDEAEDLQEKLESGENFSELAGEYSQHEPTAESGGDFGWLVPDDVAEGSVMPAWADIFNLEVGVVSEPIYDEATETIGGYWLVEVLAVEDDWPLTDDDRSLLKSVALEEWINALWDNPGNKIDRYLTNEMRDWAVEKYLEG